MDPIAESPASTTAARVSVIVPHYNDLVRLDLCLSGLQRQTVPSHEIIVADNGSPQGADAVAALIAGRARLITVDEKGAGPARNGGARVATGDVLAFTDCDCQPEPGWLAAGVGALTTADVVGGRMKVLVDDPACMTPTEAFEAIFAFDNETYVRRKSFTVTANLFCRRNVFVDVGDFKNGVSEDVEWCHRAVAKGYAIGYEARAIVGHPARRTWDELLRKWVRTSHEEYLLRKGSWKGLLVYVGRTLLLPASVLVHAPRVLMTSEISGARNRLGALQVLVQLRAWRLWNSFRLVLS